jgi:Mrp family chromosome partitioning ATPase/capsular polysaccharide biosynthesis protein
MEQVADGRRVNSTADTFTNRPATAADYLAIFRRRKWVIIGLPLMAAVITYILSATQSAVYQSSAAVSFELASVSLSTLPYDPTTYLATEARVARSTELASRVVASARVPGETPGEFLANSAAEPQAGTYILALKASADTPDRARRLADAYAREFQIYKAQLETKTIEDQLRELNATINSLHTKSGLLYENLLQQKAQLNTVGKQSANNAHVLDPAGAGAKIRPRPQRNAILGGLLGFVLGLGLAFLAEALDRRVQSEGEVEQALAVPLLGRVPRPERALETENRLVMVAAPSSLHAEPFRKLRTSVEFVNLDRHARTIMVTSAGPREGKSTTVANLAVAFARAGRRVALVDLDLRWPSLHSLFGVQGDDGITDVVVDRVTLDDALQAIALPMPDPAMTEDGSNGQAFTTSASVRSNGRSNAEGVLHLLPCGTIPPAADEFLERSRIADVLDQLSSRFDVVLIDAPPLLAVGDAMALTTKVDAMLIITRVGIDRRQLHELARQLQSARAEILGFVLTGVTHADSSYGYAYDPHAYPAERRTRV